MNSNNNRLSSHRILHKVLDAEDGAGELWTVNTEISEHFVGGIQREQLKVNVCAVQRVTKIWKNKKEYKTMFNTLRTPERIRRNTKPCSMHYVDLKEQEGIQNHVQCVTKIWKNKKEHKTMFNALQRSEITRRDTKPGWMRYEDLKEQEGIQNNVQYVTKIWKNKKSFNTMLNVLQRRERTRRVPIIPCSIRYEDLKEQAGIQNHVQCVMKIWKNKTGYETQHSLYILIFHIKFRCFFGDISKKLFCFMHKCIIVNHDDLPDLVLFD